VDQSKYWGQKEVLLWPESSIAEKIIITIGKLLFEHKIKFFSMFFLIVKVTKYLK